MLHQSLNFEKKNPTVRDTGTLGLKSHLVSEKVCVMSREAGWSCDRSFLEACQLPPTAYFMFPTDLLSLLTDSLLMAWELFGASKTFLSLINGFQWTHNKMPMHTYLGFVVHYSQAISRHPKHSLDTFFPL